MKKRIGILLLALSASALFSIPALAADENKASGFYDVGTKENVVIKAFADKTEVSATEHNVDADKDKEQWYKDSNRLVVSYTDATKDGYYGVILVEGSELPTKDSEIYYIDQLTAESSTVDFNVYPILPTETTELSLYISSNVQGFDLVKVPLNYVKDLAMYTLGDINGDGSINSIDALAALKISAKLHEATESEFGAADVTRDGSVNSIDALTILKYAAKLIDSFDIK